MSTAYRCFRNLSAVAIAMLLISTAAAAAQSTVNVSLLDMTSAMNQGMLDPPGGVHQEMMSPNGMPGQQWVPGRQWAPGQQGMPWKQEMPDQQGMMGQQGMMEMGRMSIALDKTEVKAGDVHFVVTNVSMSLPHEMLVVSGADAATILPYDSISARIPEEKINSLGEVSDLAPATVGTLDLKLEAGTYLLICNVAGHYKAGMVAILTVIP